MILPLAVFAQLSTTCAPQVALETLAAIARTESGLDPFAIHDNSTNRSYRPHDQAEAIRIAAPLLAAGNSIDAGLMGINVGNWRWLGLTTETVFDPCQNIRAGATVLTALSRYNTGSPTRGFRNGYVQRVVAKMRPLKFAPAWLAGSPGRASHPAPMPEPAAQQSWHAFDPAPASNAWTAFPSEKGE
jgi:type IV secretion system protein VirB1